MAKTLQHGQATLIARISTASAADNESIPDTARSGRTNAIVSLSRWYKKAVRPPAGTQEIVRTALTLTRPNNPFLFPQLRLRRSGDAGDGHLSERLLNAAIADLQKLGRRLHAVQQFSTHAFRAWFTTHMGRLGYGKPEIRTILDHSEGRLNNTTDMHYDLEQSLPKKFEILNAWQNFIDNISTSDAWPVDIFKHQTTYPTN